MFLGLTRGEATPSLYGSSQAKNDRHLGARSTDRGAEEHQPLTSPGFFSRSLKPFHAKFTMCAATASRPGFPTSSHHSPTTATIPTSAREYTGAIFGS